jgi:protein-tyrosine-phosphatase
VRGDELEVIFVCTGNQFRSPLAAAIFERAANGRAQVSSCGTAAVEGGPPLAEAIDLVRELTVDLAQHRTRPLESLRDADLVLGFERHHVERAVVDGSAPRERTFTLPQAVELLEANGPVGGALERLDALRPTSIFDAPEVEDPIGLPAKRQLQIAREVEDLAARLALALFD